MDLTILVDYTPLILVFGGITAIGWLLARLVKPDPDEDELISSLLKGLPIFEFIIGTLLVVTGAVVWSAQAWDPGTRLLLIVTGLAMFLKPLRNVPWAALGGLIIGTVCVFLVYVYLPLPETILGVSSTWIYLVIFLFPAVFTYMIFKFIEDVVKIIGWILASKPVATTLGVVCIIQGILLFFNQSLFAIAFS